MRDGRVFVSFPTPGVEGTRLSSVDVVGAKSRMVHILRDTVDSLIRFPSVSDPNRTVHCSVAGAASDQIETESSRFCTQDMADGTTDGAGLTYLIWSLNDAPTGRNRLSCRRRRDHRAYAELFLDAEQTERVFSKVEEECPMRTIRRNECTLQ